MELRLAHGLVAGTEFASTAAVPRRVLRVKKSHPKATLGWLALIEQYAGTMLPQHSAESAEEPDLGTNEGKPHAERLGDLCGYFVGIIAL